jgi:peptide deformylase
MLYRLVYYGNETLRKVADEVANINQEVIDLVGHIFTIMHRERGIGLAAPQIDVSKKIIGIDLEPYRGPKLTLINPVVVESSAETEPYEEGCLSVPGIMKEVIRPSRVLVTEITPEQKEMRIEAEGLLARVLQHEIDHLNGKLVVDYLEDYERKELTGELKKIRKLNRNQ